MKRMPARSALKGHPVAFLRKRARVFVAAVLLGTMGIMFGGGTPARAGYWRGQTSGTSEQLTAVHFVTPDVGYAAGGFNGGLVLKTTDGGFTWSSPSAIFGPPIQSVYFVDEMIGFVTAANSGNSRPVYRTTDGGKNWTLLFDQGGQYEWRRMAFADKDLGIAIGAKMQGGLGNLQGAVRRTIDGGKTWETPIDIAPATAAKTLVSVAYSHPNRWVAVGCKTSIACTSDTEAGAALYSTDGVSWTASTSPIPQALRSVWLGPGGSSATGYAVGRLGLILKTVNGGTTWTTLNSGTALTLNGVAFDPGGMTGNAVGARASLETSDGGETWKLTGQAQNDANRTLNAVAINGATRVAVGDGGIVLRYDSADTLNPSVSVSNPDANPSTSIIDPWPEGDEGATTGILLTVSLDSASVNEVTVDWHTEDGTDPDPSKNAIAPQDYVPATGTVTFPPGETSKTITVYIRGNYDIQLNRTFRVVLQNPNPPNVFLFKGRASVTIQDDDERSIRIGANPAVPEGDSGASEVAVPVTLIPESPVTVTVEYDTSDGIDPNPDKNAIAGQDYQAASGTLTIPVGVTQTAIPLLVKGDTDPEQPESFYLNLHDAAGAVIARAQATITIANDDQTAYIVVDDPARVTEGGPGETAQAIFNVRLVRTTGGTVTVDYATADKYASGTDSRRATPDGDFGAASGTLTFLPGTESLPVAVTVNGDANVEDNEEFRLVLSGQSSNAEISCTDCRSEATATVVDDDLPPEGVLQSAGGRGAMSSSVLWGDPAVGIFYEVGTSQTRVWDLETRSVIKTFNFSGAAYVDQDRHRLFLLSDRLRIIDASDGEFELDPRTEGKSIPLSGAASAHPVLGLSSYTTTNSDGEVVEDRLYILRSSQRYFLNENPGIYQVYVQQVDLLQLVSDDWTVASVNPLSGAFWEHWVAGCPTTGRLFKAPMGSKLALVRKGPYVGVACTYGSPHDNLGAHDGGRGGVARVLLGPDGRPKGTEFFSMVGRSVEAGQFSDPVTGRIFFQNGSTFDVDDGAWLNQVPTTWGPNSGHPPGAEMTARPLAIDHATGRGYYATDRIVDVRLPNEIPTGGVVFGPSVAESSPGVVDWERRQVVFSGGVGIVFLKDGTPAIPPVVAADPDANTVDVEETEGVTGRQYKANTQAYGAKVRWVGGLIAIIPSYDPWANELGDTQLITPNLNTLTGGDPLLPAPGTRELTLAAVHSTDLTHTQSNALAFGVYADPATTDETDPAYWMGKCLRRSGSSCDHSSPPPPPGGSPFNYAEATCSNTIPTGVADDGRSAVLCDQAGGQVDAGATYFGATQEGAPVQVKAANVYTLSRLDPLKGIVATSVSEVYGVTLGGPGFGAEVRIGAIRSEATSFATGRKKRPGDDGHPVSGPGYGAEGTLDRTFSDVWVTRGADTIRICQEVCDTSEVIASINQAVGAFMRVWQPGADPAIEGTPGGAEAKVVLNEGDVAVAVQMEDDDAERKEIPALAISLANDSLRKSRVVVRLAGVMTVTAMEINCIYGPVLGPNNLPVGCNPDPGTLPSTLKIHLTDEENGKGDPLEGAVFEIYQDADANGLLDPGVDLPVELPTLPGAGSTACTTGEDGVGDCLFEGLYAGKYFVHQVSAPEGYAPVEDFDIVVDGGIAYTIDLANLPAIGFVSLTLGDDSTPSNPLAGGVFDLYQDADSDAALGPADQKLATCTTDNEGRCRFNQDQVSDDLLVASCTLEEIESGGESFLVVKECTGQDQGNFLVAPFGSYLMVEAQAPKDYDLPSGGLAFTFDQPKQYAPLTFSNGLLAIPGTDATQGTAGSFQPATVYDAPSQAPRVASRSNRGLVAFVRKVFDGFKFLLASPSQALRTAALWGFFTLPLILSLRRRWLPT